MASSTIGMLRTVVPSVVPPLKQQMPAVMTVECSSRPQKKATAHHRKTRPKKTQPWDVKRRGPTAYPPLPTLPTDWTLVSSSAEEQGRQQQEMEEAAAAEVITA